ncbi:discoidin domain-containing protein [Luteimonas sp. RIT-PG2_3]
MRHWLIVPVSTLLWLGSLPVAAQPVPPDVSQVRVLDDFSTSTHWRVVTSNQVSGTLRSVEGEQGPALCLDYDFNGVSGYAGIQRDLKLTYPENYQFRFRLRGDTPNNDLQFKLVDASGDNVWWVNRPRYDFPRRWREVRYKQRHIDKAWGPDPDRVLRASEKVEFTIYNNVGGRGSVCFDELSLEPLPVDDGSPLRPVQVLATANADEAMAIVDGDPDTAWEAPMAEHALALDLGRVREFGGLRLRWNDGKQASRYSVELSDDGERWRAVRDVRDGNGGDDWLALPESEARYIRIELQQGPGRRFALAEAEVLPLAFSAHPNDVIKAMAAKAPKGQFPRGFSGEQPYWTILGIDGGDQQGLIGEDGAVEVARGGFSLEPFVLVDGRLVSWADVTPVQSLDQGYLPMPQVQWTRDDLDLRINAFASGNRRESQLVVRYRLTNPGPATRDYTLALVAQPFQVNPPSQFLNTIGGVSRIEALSIKSGTLSVAGVPRVFSKQVPTSAFATTFDAGMAVSHLAGSPAGGSGQTGSGQTRSGRDAKWPTTTSVEDPTGLASGALLYQMRLRGWESREISVMVPMTGRSVLAQRWWDAGLLQQATAETWQHSLDKVRFSVPPQGQALVDTLRTSTAHMLISRIGPRLQPGTRSYSRSWIRDGAMISEGLLRMGREDVVRDYVEWYAPYQFKNGMVPCCVDDRGSDPVPENDSHGELIFNIAEYWRYTGDDAFLERMWPHVLAAFEYMEVLSQSERTRANQARNPAFYGMMPASISHEGYSAKPMHSYWDNFWAMRGYKDAVQVAQALGKTTEHARMVAARDRFRADLQASLLAAAKLHGIDFLPGAAELGDFDATSTTIALAPGGEMHQLPQDLLHNTFERYYREFVQRRDGQREWKDYTPYEWRNVAAFVRLGWRERAWEVVDYFFKDRVPQPWNQWAEVVSKTPRKPFFLGDLPHAWVGSDFVRSALDMFAYVRESDESLVLAAGIPADWLDHGIEVHGLRTPDGELGYRLARHGDTLVLDVDADAGMPVGGLVLPWPYPSIPGATTLDGEPVQWQGRELRIGKPGAKVVIKL